MKIVRRRRFVITEVDLRGKIGSLEHSVSYHGYGDGGLREAKYAWKKNLTFSFYQNYNYLESEILSMIRSFNDKLSKQKEELAFWVKYEERSHFLSLEDPDDLNDGSYEVVE